VLPPATLLELKRLTGLTATSFRLPDDLWARIVYDFALAHRLRIMNRDHLLKAMTPVYLAWVASYTTEVGAAAPAAIEYRLERLGAAFESQKPYLVSRWRWPDRFNP
jgi:glucosylglycerate synthase